MLSNLQQLGLSNNNLGGRIPSALSRLFRLQVLSLENNNFTSVPSELALLRNIYFMDVRGNPVIRVLHPLICCSIQGLRTDVDCSISNCSHYGNPWTAAGCREDETQLDFRLSRTVTISICTKACTSGGCTADTPPWNPSGVARCALTRSGTRLCNIVCLSNSDCGSPHALCLDGLLDASVRDKSTGRAYGVCVYLKK